ncbi:MAG: hypothetical protein WHX52_22735 [Anaerolineae bacterium]
MLSKVTRKTVYFLLLLTLVTLILGSGLVIGINNVSKGRIVYTKNIYGQFEGIYIMDPDGNNVNRIPMACISHPISPVWSPDGQWIAFGCRTGKLEQNLCILDQEGRTTSGILTNGADCYSYNGLIDIRSVSTEFCSAAIESVSWAPDGQRLAFTCPHQNQSGALTCIVDLDGTILNCWPLSLVVGIDTKRNGTTSVAWSSVTDQLALSFVAQDTTKSGIYLTSIDGKSATFLTQGHNPRWSPRGNQLAFVLTGICIIDTDGKNLYCPYDRSKSSTVTGDWEALPNFFGGYVSWSPNGHSLVFSAGQTSSGSPTAIYTLDIRKNVIHQITNSYDGLFEYLDWSP